MLASRLWMCLVTAKEVAVVVIHGWNAGIYFNFQKFFLPRNPWFDHRCAGAVGASDRTDLIKLKREKINEKDLDRECLELLREIVLINEKQKSALSTLRKNKLQNEDETLSLDLNPNDENEKQSILMYNEGNEDSKDDEETITEEDDQKSSQNHLYSNTQDDLNSTNYEDTLSPFTEDKPEDDLLCLEESEGNFNSPEEDQIMDDVHDLVTSYEFMQSLGLLTIQECEAVLHNRRERHKKNAFSHVFCQSVWEKQETKRKKRDWLISSSPPQLRRKIRPNSQPPSRQPSRPTSPLEGSSSPPSSLSPPSPISPGAFNQLSQNSDEICSSCKTKGASFQCDGCGVHFHTSCIIISEEESCGLTEWLCSKCEKMGLRASVYNDPLRQRF